MLCHVAYAWQKPEALGP